MLDSIFNLSTLWWLLLILYIPSCIGLILIVLLQKGKGGGFAGAFGAGGGSDAVFGPRTARSLPQKITYTMAAIFMIFAFVLSFISGKVTRGPAPGLMPEANITSTAAESEGEDGQAVTIEVPEEDAAPNMEVEVQTNESPAEETPAEAAPVEEAPAEEAPVEEAPAAETPAEGAAVEETPADVPAEEANDETAQ